MVTQALILNAVVLAVVLESDLGPHRRVTWFRVGRPIITALLIVPFFIKGVAITGNSLWLEIVLTFAGLALGLGTAALMRVYRSPRTGGPVTSAGLPYAILWTAVIVARAAFSFGSAHWFGASLARWMSQHDVTSAALTDGLIFMALAMIVVRVVAMGVRTARLEPSLGSSPNRVNPAPTDTAGRRARLAGRLGTTAVRTIASRRESRHAQRDARRHARGRI